MMKTGPPSQGRKTVLLCHLTLIRQLALKMIEQMDLAIQVTSPLITKMEQFRSSAGQEVDVSFKGESMYPYQEDKCSITLDALKWVD